MAPARKPKPENSPPREQPSFELDLPQAEFEIQFFARILARHPNYIEVLRRQAQLLAQQGKFEDAVELDRRLVSLQPESCFANYNLACSLARLGHCREALKALKQAVKLGYDDFGHLSSDPDLSALHGLPAFQSLLRRAHADL